jgi:hypothetical protein
VTMPDDAMLSERSAWLDEASRIVATASAEGRELTEAEDSHVLRLLRRAQVVEEVLSRLKRRQGEHRKI